MSGRRTALSAGAVSVTALFLFLAGCAAGPDYVRPSLPDDMPAAWAQRDTLSGPSDETTTATAVDQERWWEAFGDRTLNALVEQSLQNNQDLAAAIGRILEAEAQLGGAASAQWPSLEIGGTASRSKSSADLSRGFGLLYSTVFTGSVSLGYELDLWGRLSRGKEAAVASVLASRAERRAVAQSLIAGVVRTWLTVRELQLQVDLNERTVASLAHSLETVSDRYRRGLVSALDVHLARQNLASAQAAGPTYRQELNAARRRLEILVGRYPGGWIETDDQTPTAFPDPLPPVPAGLPSDLLERRPDLQAAELRLHAATAQIGQAKAALYPRISLTASAGTSSNELSHLFTEPADIWSLVGNLFAPLLNRGAYTSQVDASEARSLQAAAQYRSAVLEAFSEVENALDQDVYQRDKEDFLTDSVLQARRSVELAEERYARGLDSLLVTLETQRRLYNAESQLLSTQRARRAARVDLILALGGPWDTQVTASSVVPETAATGAADRQGADQ